MLTMTILSGSYDYRLVALSIALAGVAAYLALHLAGRTSPRHAWLRVLWPSAGPAAWGMGILQKSNLNTSRERELYFQTMAEAVPEIIWTADPNGTDDYFNQKWFDYTGLTLEQSRGTGWTVVVHPDDLGLCAQKWENAQRTGQPYDVEYRLRGRNETYRWFLCRGNPIRGFLKSRFWNGPCNWPTPIPGCSRKFLRKIPPAGNSISTTK